MAVSPDGQQEFTLTGTIEIPITAGAFFVVFDFETAQQLYGKEGQVDAIALSRAPGVEVADMITAVEAVIPPEATVQSQQQIIEESSADFEQIINIFRNLLLGFALVALFVSLFIIYNTFQILINQRLQQIGMLRAIGATKRQIRFGVVIEALIVGIIGSALGIAFGLAVAELIKLAFSAGGGFPETGTVIAARTIYVCLGVGLVATVIAALLPAFRAGRVSPIAAMRNESPARSSFRRRVIIGSVVLVVGLVLVGLGLVGSGGTVTAIVTQLGIGAVLTFVGVAMLSVLFAGPIVNLMGRSWVLGAALAGLGVALPVLIFAVGDGVPGGIVGWITFVLKLFVSAMAIITGVSILLTAATNRGVGLGSSAAGLEGRLARQNAARAPQRTAATATALTIGIALVSTVGVIGESLKATFSETLENAINADLFIFDEETQSPFSGQLADDLEALDGIETLARFRVNEIRLGEDDVQDLAVFDAATGEDIIDFSVSDGSVEGLVDNGVLVFADAAEDRGLSVGDTITAEFPDLETEELTVVGIFEDSSIFPFTNWVIDTGVLERHVNNTDDVFVGAAIAPDADAEAVKAEVVAITDTYSSVSAQDTAEFQESQEGQIDQLVTLINYLLGFALVVAFLGVINTIVLSVVERTREIGLLRAVGMTRDQIRSSIRWEAVIVCLFGALVGIVLGILFGAAAVNAIPESIVSKIAVPLESILFAILAAALAGVVAALLPARRAANLNVLDAIAGND
ncbi:MAG: FtsX-like permease family protein [Actinomycetota bacterium]